APIWAEAEGSTKNKCVPIPWAKASIGSAQRHRGGVFENHDLSRWKRWALAHRKILIELAALAAAEDLAEIFLSRRNKDILPTSRIVVSSRGFPRCRRDGVRSPR